jgi:hypothetical protein
MIRLLERLNTPTALLVVTFAATAANVFLYFAFYLPKTSTVTTNDPGVGAKSNLSDGFPELERRGEIYSTPDVLPAPAGDPVLAGAGDIAVCGANGDDATAKLIEDMPNATVVTLGDHAFEDGTASEFADCYGPSWGRFTGPPGGASRSALSLPWATTTTRRPVPPATSATSVRRPGARTRATTPTNSGTGMWCR